MVVFIYEAITIRTGALADSNRFFYSAFQPFAKGRGNAKQFIFSAIRALLNHFKHSAMGCIAFLFSGFSNHSTETATNQAKMCVLDNSPMFGVGHIFPDYFEAGFGYRP